MFNLTAITIILLVVFIIALITDICLLVRISRKGNIMDTIDAKYFELKYHINLIRSVAAIVLFLFAFFGFRTIGDVEKRLTTELTDSIQVQNAEINTIQIQLEGYSIVINKLEKLNISLSSSLKQSEDKLKILNDKLIILNETYKYNPKIYITELRFSMSYDHLGKDRKPKRFYFNEMKTIFGEDFPIFKEIPSVNIEGYKQQFMVLEVTNTSVLIGHGASSYNDKSIPDHLYDFNMWVTSSE